MENQYASNLPTFKPLLRHIGTAFLLLSVLSLTQTVSADENTSVLEEVLVTALKRTTVLKDTPLSVYVNSGEEIEKLNINSSLDLSFGIAGFTVSEQASSEQRFTIRGIGNNFGSASLVGVYLDEIDVTGQGQFQSPLSVYDLERVELLRGPQGTLYGAGSVGGTVRYVTMKPDTKEFSAKADASISDSSKSSDQNYNLRAAANFPVVEETLALRAAVTYEDEAGWIDAPDAGLSDINDNEQTDIRISVRLSLERFNADLVYIDYQNDVGAPNIANLSLEDSDTEIFIDPDFDLSFDYDYQVYGATFSYEFEFATLTSATGIIETDLTTNDSRRLVFEGPQAFLGGADVALVNSDSDFEVKTTTQELRLNSIADGPFSWVFGGFWRKEEQSSSIWQQIGLEFTGAGIPTVILPPSSLSLGDIDNTSWAVFGNIDYDINDRVTAGLGLRYFEDDRSTDGNSETFDDVSPRAYLAYDATDDVNFYFSYAQGFRSGGFNPSFVVAVGNSETYDVENVDSVELGMKGDFLEGRLYAEVAFFYSEYTDLQGVFIDPIIFQNVTTNFGDADIMGIDASITLAVTENLRFSANGNYTDHEFTDVTENGAHIEGDKLDQVTDESFSLSIDYQRPLTDGLDGYLRTSFNRQGEFRITNRSSGRFPAIAKSDTVDYVNAIVGVTLGSTYIEVFGENLLDEDGSITPNVSGLQAQYRPKTVGLRVGTKL